VIRKGARYLLVRAPEPAFAGMVGWEFTVESSNADRVVLRTLIAGRTIRVTAFTGDVVDGSFLRVA
jgi:hypothetical protein